MKPARVLLAGVQRAATLPECPGCDRPVKRSVAERHGGFCSSCSPSTPAALFDAAGRAMRTPSSAR